MGNRSSKYFMGNSGEIASFEIERRQNLTYNEFRNEYLIPRKPVIITDATKNWEARKWTPEWFKQRYPGKVLQTDQGEMKMEDFIDAITSQSDEPGPFLREKPLQELFPDLVNHVLPTPPYIQPNWLEWNFGMNRVNNKLNRLSLTEVNFCGKRIFPYLHIDYLQSYAFISQLYGDKHVVVYPPSQEHLLYRKGDEGVSQIYDVDNPDLSQYPLFAETRPTRFVLKAGESVFMPNGWWHTTRVYGASLSTVYSVVNSNNWADLVNDFKKESGLSPLKGKLLGIYLQAFAFLKSIIS